MSPRKSTSKETGSTHTSILAHPEGRNPWFGSHLEVEGGKNTLEKGC